MSQHRLYNDLTNAHMPDSGNVFYIPSTSGRLFGWGTSVPSAEAGWTPGAIFIDTDSTERYKNTGTATSCTFTACTDALDAAGYLPLAGGSMTGALNFSGAVVGTGTAGSLLTTGTT
jgi:hypothetical protein